MKKTILTALIAALTLFVLAGCVPLDPNAVMSDDAAVGETESMEAAAEQDGGAMATITTRSLRVRAEPNTDADVVAGVREGETYRVLGLSDDGQWVQIEVDRAEDGVGWVAANLVSINGAVSGTTDGLILVPTPAATAAGAEEEADAGAAVEPTPVPAPEPGFAAVSTDGTRLRVRSEPNTEADIVGYIYVGETYEVVGGTEDGVWVQIAGSSDAESDNPDGGWVAAEFLVIGE